jgi:uncharacterized protein (DUF1778 family)
MLHINDMISIIGGIGMNQTIAMSIRGSEEKLGKLTKAAKIENYSSCSEFIRRTVLIEAEKNIKSKEAK